jgi:hypothetical protein
MHADYNNSGFLEFDDLLKLAKGRNMWSDSPLPNAEPYYNEWLAKLRELEQDQPKVEKKKPISNEKSTIPKEGKINRVRDQHGSIILNVGTALGNKVRTKWSFL